MRFLDAESLMGVKEMVWLRGGACQVAGSGAFGGNDAMDVIHCPV